MCGFLFFFFYLLGFFSSVYLPDHTWHVQNLIWCRSVAGHLKAWVTLMFSTITPQSYSMVTNGFIYLSFYLNILICLTKQQRHISLPTPRKEKSRTEASNLLLGPSISLVVKTWELQITALISLQTSQQKSSPFPLYLKRCWCIL